MVSTAVQNVSLQPWYKFSKRGPKSIPAINSRPCYHETFSCRSFSERGWRMSSVIFLRRLFCRSIFSISNRFRQCVYKLFSGVRDKSIVHYYYYLFAILVVLDQTQRVFRRFPRTVQTERGSSRYTSLCHLYNSQG